MLFLKILKKCLNQEMNVTQDFRTKSVNSVTKALIYLEQIYQTVLRQFHITILLT